MNLGDKHWVAIWISIPKRHIVVRDSIPSSSVPSAWDAIMEPFLEMVPYLLVESRSQQTKYGLEPYTYERPLKGVPTPTMVIVACLKKMRDNMAVDIWKELVDQHLKENVDGDKFVGMYD
ncbi:hypothetical protein Bca52824_039956 [Brassica carinata]|uniref:Ubiquitin-like protease family profile domain-containing protein n=1 Tax=Brassica carinata TaxID=52824 RepID=A0A8X7RSL6_BRACI|nr:hypothetical protein Bca52824_039956 [Brassica carinata]